MSTPPPSKPLTRPHQDRADVQPRRRAGTEGRDGRQPQHRRPHPGRCGARRRTGGRMPAVPQPGGGGRRPALPARRPEPAAGTPGGAHLRQRRGLPPLPHLARLRRLRWRSRGAEWGHDPHRNHRRPRQSGPPPVRPAHEEGHSVTSIIRNPDHAADVAATGATPSVLDVENSTTAAIAEASRATTPWSGQPGPAAGIPSGPMRWTVTRPSGRWTRRRRPASGAMSWCPTWARGRTMASRRRTASSPTRKPRRRRMSTCAAPGWPGPSWAPGALTDKPGTGRIDVDPATRRAAGKPPAATLPVWPQRCWTCPKPRAGPSNSATARCPSPPRWSRAVAAAPAGTVGRAWPRPREA